jgi:SnoaL-like domain
MVSLTWEDRIEITELLSRYALLLDQQRLDEWMDLFMADAVIDIDGQPSLTTIEGRRHLGQTAPRGTHLCAPPVLREGDVEGTALAEQTYVFRNIATGGLLSGWYEDALVKSNGTWRFVRLGVHFHRPEGARS